MDSKLEFKGHNKTKAAAAMRAFRTISSLANTEKDLSLQSLRKSYPAFITTVGDNVAEVWWKGTKT